MAFAYFVGFVDSYINTSGSSRLYGLWCYKLVSGLGLFFCLS